MVERVLSLDISTKTGWALLISGDDGEYNLEASGQYPQKPEPDDVPYPSNYVNWAYANFEEIVNLIDTHHPDVLVIEETTVGHNAFSQKILEFTHFLVARLIRDTGIKCSYFLTGQWRSLVGSSMTKDEKKRNAAVKKYKVENETKLARDSNGKVMGKITSKHVAVRRANELFGKFFPKELKKKDEDMADALLIAFAYHTRKMKR